jgi:hypothetical protein
MSVEAVCTICGKSFFANAHDERGLCADCQAAAVSERPVSPIRSARTAIQDERIRAAFPPGMDRTSNMEKPNDPDANRHSSLVVAIVFAAMFGAALAIVLVFACGKLPESPL